MSSRNDEDMPPGILRNRERGPLDASQIRDSKDNIKIHHSHVGDIVSHPPQPPSRIYLAGDEDDDDEDEEEEDDEYRPTYPSINPLNTNTTDLELETIRNNYYNNNRDDMESMESDGVTTSMDNSPMPKRTSVFSGHEHEDTDDFLLSTMLAIRTAVLAGTRDAIKQTANLEDFSATRKHKISMAGDRKVEVKDYAPAVFAVLRRKFGISIPSYLLSWSDHRLAKSRSAGKSESMFIHSPDNKFVLKTLTKSEAKRLRKLLHSYYEHMTTNPDTFLSRIYGLHRMSRRRGQSLVYFTILNNVFETPLPLTEVYDLKGSTVGRRASAESTVQQRRSSTSFEFLQIRKAVDDEKKKEEEPVGPTKKLLVLKDLDFTRKLHVGPENRKKVLTQIAADCKFLAEHKLMDYSLLIGVRCEPPPSTPDSPVVQGTMRGSTSLPLGSSPESQRVSQSPRRRTRHSFYVTGSAGQRVPGLLFFLESTKAASAKNLSREGKKPRRKSLSLGKPSFASSEELNAIDEDESTDLSASVDGSATTTPESSFIHLNNEPTPTTSPTENHTANTDPASNANGADKPLPNDTNNTPPSTNGTTTASTTNNSDPSTNGTHDHNAHPKKETSNPDATSTNVTSNDANTDKETNNNDATITAPSATTSDEPSPASPAPAINVIPASPPANDDANSIQNGNGHPTEDVEEKDSTENGDDDSDSPSGSPPKPGIPTFNFSGGPKGVQTSRSGTVLNTHHRYSNSAHNSPRLIKKPSRSSSLTYINMDTCDNPHIPFFKAYEGGMIGTSMSPTDPNKKQEIYYIGIIDFLQKYNKKKMLAGFAKSFKYEREELSTVDPGFYMERFMKMVDKAITE